MLKKKSLLLAATSIPLAACISLISVGCGSEGPTDIASNTGEMGEVGSSSGSSTEMLPEEAALFAESASLQTGLNQPVVLFPRIFRGEPGDEITFRGSGFDQPGLGCTFLNRRAPDISAECFTPEVAQPGGGDPATPGDKLVLTIPEGAETGLVYIGNGIQGVYVFYTAPLELPTPRPRQPVKLTLLHNNDGESQLISAPGQPDFGGIARFATLVDQLRSEAESLDDGGEFKSIPLLVTSGDNTLAGPEFTAGLENVARGGVLYDSIGLDLIGYDAFALGNHDFDFGPDILAEFITGFSTPPFAPFVSANLDFSGEPSLSSLVSQGRIVASTVINKDGERFGIVGATTEALRSISSPRNVRVNPVQPAVQAEVNALLAQRVNKIILISHLQDVEEDLELISQLSGIDVAVAGGGDELLVTPSQGTLLVPGDEGLSRFGDYPLMATDATGRDVPVVTTPGDYKYLGRLVVDFDESGNVIGVDPSSALKRVSGVGPDAVSPDPTIQSLVVDPVASFVAGLDSNVIATSEVALEGRRDPGIRTEETNLGNLLADALRWQGEQLASEFGVSAPDVALQNGGGIRNNNLIPAGPFTELNTFDIAPFPNFVAIVPNIPRTQFKEILENAVSRAPSADGRFAQVSGFSFTYDVSGTPQQVTDDGIVLTPGTRVVDVTLDDGTPIVVGGLVQPGPDLTIATNDFSARGGDQYPFRGAPFTSVGVSYQLALSNYIQDELAGVISADDYPEGGEGRIISQ
jgi:5'-nucleotidase